jgi:hypothetical protein
MGVRWLDRELSSECCGGTWLRYSSPRLVTVPRLCPFLTCCTTSPHPRCRPPRDHFDSPCCRALHMPTLNLVLVLRYCWTCPLPLPTHQA